MNNVSIQGGSEGSIHVEGNGGTSSYTYIWSNGGSAAEINGLTAGTYHVTTTDSNGCTANSSVTITSPPETVTVSLIELFNVTCHSGTNGMITVGGYGGASPYSYLWSNGETTAAINGLGAATYSVTVTDNNGFTVTSAVTITEPTALTLSVIEVIDVSCQFGSNGMIQVGVAGGTGPYAYLWSNGQTSTAISGQAAGTYTVTATDYRGCTTVLTENIQEPSQAVTTVSVVETDNSCTPNDATLLVQDQSTLTAVPNGLSPFTYAWSNSGGSAVSAQYTNSTVGSYTYTVTVTSADGCTATGTKSVAVVSLPLLSSNPLQVSCYGLSTGAIDLTVSSNYSPFNYLWSNGQSIQDISSLVIGTYTVTVTDANGCTRSTSETLTQPTLLSSGVVGFLASCTATNGTTNLSVAGGLTPYTYNWSNSTTTEDLNGLGFGTYTVTVTDNNSCTTTSSITLGATCRRFTGKLKWFTDLTQGVGATTVALSGNTVASLVTVPDGLFNMIGDGFNFAITPTKTTGKFNGLTALDAARLAQMVSGTGPFTSPYQFIAGDVDNNNQLNTLDVAYIKQALLNNPIALLQFKKSWRFVPAAHTFPTPYGTGVFWSFPEKINYVNITTSQTDQDFVGIKIGDLVVPNTNPALKPAPPVPVVFQVPDLELLEDSIVQIPFRCLHFEDLVALQASFWFNPNVLSFVSVTPIAGMPFQLDNFGTWNLMQGHLRLVWAAGQALTVAGQPLVFTVRFRVLAGGFMSHQVLSVSEKDLDPLAWHTDYRPEPVKMTYVTALEVQEQNGLPVALKTGTTGIDFVLYQNKPNPCVDKTEIGFILPEATVATLTVFDETGRFIYTQKGYYHQGYNTILFDCALVNQTGSIYYTLETDKFFATKQMMRVK
jgi:hypothetical protein